MGIQGGNIWSPIHDKAKNRTVHEDGSLGNREVFGSENLGYGAYVDGFAFDIEGNLWVTTVWRNGLIIITPDGEYHFVFEELFYSLDSCNCCNSFADFKDASALVRV